jgi:hypothetical protein
MQLAHPPEAKEQNCIWFRHFQILKKWNRPRNTILVGSTFHFRQSHLTNGRLTVGQGREGFETQGNHPSPRKEKEQALS